MRYTVVSQSVGQLVSWLFREESNMTTTTTTREIRMQAIDVAFAGCSGYHLAEVGIPADFCEVAAATCCLEIMGWHRGRHNGDAPRQQERRHYSGRWVHIQLATYGKRPHGPARHNWRSGCVRPRYIHADNISAADYILGCYGLTTNQVIDWATGGNGIGDDDRIRLSLREIVEALRPDLLSTDTMIASADNAAECRNRNLNLL